MLGFFALEHAKVSVSPELNLHLTLRECLTRAIAAFDITNSELLCARASLSKVLSSIFDAENLPLVSEESSQATCVADNEKKASLLVQGFAGIIAIASQLAGREVTADLLNSHTEAFAPSERRTDMVSRIVQSDVLRDCTLKVQLEDLIVEAALDKPSEPAVYNDFLPLTEEPVAPLTSANVEEDPFYDSEEEEEEVEISGNSTPSYPREHIGLNTNEWDHSRPATNMGLPWGFTIMALN